MRQAVHFRNKGKNARLNKETKKWMKEAMKFWTWKIKSSLTLYKASWDMKLLNGLTNHEKKFNFAQFVENIKFL